MRDGDDGRLLSRFPINQLNATRRSARPAVQCRNGTVRRRTRPAPFTAATAHVAHANKTNKKIHPSKMMEIMMFVSHAAWMSLMA